MSYKISKELFEAVMDVKKECYLQDIELIDENKIIYSYLVDEQFQEPRYDEELINDFFFKCKDWALKQGYIIGSYSDGLVILSSNKNVLKMIEWRDFTEHPAKYKSEQQEVFDSCQYILDNKDKQ